MTAGKRISQLRAVYGESLREAAQRTKVSHTTIARIENGQVTESYNRTVRKIADGYGVTAEYLMTGKGLMDVELQLRLAVADEVQVDPVILSGLVRVMRKAIEARLSPELVEMAIDLVALRSRHVAAGRN